MKAKTVFLRIMKNIVAVTFVVFFFVFVVNQCITGSWDIPNFVTAATSVRATSDIPESVSYRDIVGSEAVVTEVIGLYHGVQIIKIASGDGCSYWESVAIASRNTVFTKGDVVCYGVIAYAK